MDRKQIEIWTNGRKGCTACISGKYYETGAIVVGAECIKLTEHQMHKALGKKFPGVKFDIVRRADMWVARSK